MAAHQWRRCLERVASLGLWKPFPTEPASRQPGRNRANSSNKAMSWHSCRQSVVANTMAGGIPIDVALCEMLSSHWLSCSSGRTSRQRGHRDFHGHAQPGSSAEELEAMQLEHYPGMTERQLQNLAAMPASGRARRADSPSHWPSDPQSGSGAGGRDADRRGQPNAAKHCWKPSSTMRRSGNKRSAALANAAGLRATRRCDSKNPAASCPQRSRSRSVAGRQLQ